MSERTIPDPPAGMRYLAGPVPDPPEKGWWLDPDDTALMRYYNGEHWTDQARPSMQRVQGAKGVPAVKRKPIRAYFGKGELSTTMTILAGVGLAIAVVLVPFGAPAFSQGSLAYEWTNRVGIFVLYSVLVPYFFVTLYMAMRHDPEGVTTPGLRIALPFIGLVPLVILTVVLWNRILEALWLR
jgi:Protein of unknown function (DUF2510)